jgi:hypothetical protein
MFSQTLLYIGAAISVLWGIAHLFPTRSVVSGFGDISLDNRHIITMEWIIEGVALIFIGVLVASVTMIDYQNAVSGVVYVISSVTLLILAVVSLLTGFKVNFFPFKLCPILFTISAVLIFVASLL